MTGTKSQADTQTEPTTDELEAQLAALQAQVNARREAEQAAKRAEALSSAREAIAKISTDAALVAMDEGNFATAIQALNKIITEATDARKGVASAARDLQVRVPRAGGSGNGGTRESAIRDEVQAVFDAHPGVWFSPTELSHEVPPSPTGNPRSSGAILNALEGMVRNGQAEESDGRPRKFRGVQPRADATE